ncbi:hypothetical protein CEXT_652921 [Caerostris extrusa]|uniref:Uncharacterized protein n=1 Tax=Caerostris extrusa TaxID=172846 RepID=A0AAV4XSM6_CAEEX|nr:hypothetical protein CEXT_652921 [Caerostris extrusa]
MNVILSKANPIFSPLLRNHLLKTPPRMSTTRVQGKKHLNWDQIPCSYIKVVGYTGIEKPLFQILPSLRWPLCLTAACWDSLRIPSEL